MIFLTRRRKIILFIVTPVVVVSIAAVLGNYLTTLNFDANGTTRLSNSDVSTIDKSQSNSQSSAPISGAESEKKDQEKALEKPKSDNIEIASKVQAPTLQPKFAPRNNASNGVNLIEGTELARLSELANQRKSSGIQAEIKKLEFRIANLDAEIKEINRKFDEDYNKPNDPDAPGSRRAWEETRQIKLYSCDPSIDCPAIRIEQNKAELERLKRELANPKPLTAEEIKLIKQGMLPVPDNPYAWGYGDEAKNPTLNRLKQENLNRVFNIPSYYSRVSSSISKLEYAGWDKKDVSNNFSTIFSKHGITGDSIKVYEYTPNSENPDRANRSPIKTIVLDADDNNAFNKFQTIMNEAIQQDNKIQSVVLRNVGSLNSLQNINPILKAIPSSVIKLGLFLNNPAATRGLRGLENVKLKELELYSDANARSQQWAINPNALKNIDFISFDYQGQYNVVKNAGEKIPSSITFNTIRFDKGDELAQINAGFEIVFNSKINQRVFQGNFGGKGGWPSYLDFSDTNIKTLKGIWFDEFNRVYNINVENWPDDPFAKENYQGKRTLKFKRITFQNDEVGGSPAYVANLSDFDGAQFAERLAFGEPGPPPVEIRFMKNGQEAFNIPLYLKGQNLTGDAKSQIETFIRAANANGQRRITKIYVENESVKSKLGNKIGQVLIEIKSITGNKGANNENSTTTDEIQV